MLVLSYGVLIDALAVVPVAMKRMFIVRKITKAFAQTVVDIVIATINYQFGSNWQVIGICIRLTMFRVKVVKTDIASFKLANPKHYP